MAVASVTATGSRFESVASETDLQLKLAEAHAKGQATLVDFYADWCVSCKAIEAHVFGDPQVQRALAGMRLLRADVTDNAPSHQALMRAHDVVGPPTVMLFDADGHEQRDARAVGELGAAEFLQRLDSLKRAGAGAAAGAISAVPSPLAAALPGGATRFSDPFVQAASRADSP